MENNRVVQATGILAVLLSGMIAILSLEPDHVQWFFFFIWLWVVLIACLFFKHFVSSSQLLRSTMYLLIGSTFLNQSLMSIHSGFFSIFIYRLLLIAAGLIFILHAVHKKGLADEWNQIHVKGVLLFLICWIAYGSISLLWSQSIIDGIKYLFLLSIGIAFVFLSVFAFTKINRLYLFYVIWMMMTIVLLAIGLLNHFAKVQLPTSTLYGGPAYKLAYPTAVFTNQNDFATFLTISFFFYLSAARNRRENLLKLASIALAGLSVYIVFLTESRASLIGIVLGTAVYLFILLPSRMKRAGTVAGIILLAGSLIAFGGRIAGKITAAYSGNQPMTSNVIRSHLLLNTIHYVADTFGFGVGAGNLPYYLKNEPIYDTRQIDEVHNWLAEILGNFGLLIVLGYITMYLFLFISLYRAWRLHTGREQKTLIEALVTALVAFLVSSISPSSVSNLYFHWVFLGLVIATVSVLRSERAVRDQL
ncbi:O-antigen ligase domain-containing protein [Sporolactobacillus sp. THM7-4]|nr:O-antigen ligase domain-containing protein [Sporolactobacillus sp. THM7-4]